MDHVAEAQGAISTFHALRHRNYRLFFFGYAISLIGAWMQVVAQQWLIYRLTGSAAMLGTINFLALLPVGPLALLSGSMADRFSKRAILVLTQSMMMASALILAVLAGSGAVRIWHVVAMAMLLGAANALDGPARQAFMAEMVEGKEDLTSAIGLGSAIMNIARIAGPAVAGVIVATAGEAGAFFITGATFIPIIVGLLLMRLPDRPRELRRPGIGPHLMEAVRYTWGQQSLMVLLSLVAMSAFLSMPYIMLLPVFAQDVLQASAQPLLQVVCARSYDLFTCQSPDALTYGLLMSAMGVGGIIGALLTASLPASAQRGRWLTLGNLSFPALLIGMALSRSLPVTLILLVGIGFSQILQNVLSNTLIQLAVPDELRARVMSFFTLTLLGTMRLGGVQAGVVGDSMGAQVAVGVGALLCLAYSVLVAYHYPAVREMR
jgi:MFS family permease